MTKKQTIVPKNKINEKNKKICIITMLQHKKNRKKQKNNVITAKTATAAPKSI
ncbi:MAG: hypothetical protein KAS90_00010 [Candidatus Aenigmarchaeota archaeon]|nr:hypothetical protein [Candidatus Aenigmarchaeota archaeon]